MRKYAGIGSRSTPSGVLALMREIGRQNAEAGWLLRSGGADGADSAFEQGCHSVGGKMEIFLPWAGFNKNRSNLCTVKPEAFQLASQIHPAWNILSYGAKKLHARNCYQILGSSLDDPVECVICWTPNGEAVGGTATAIALAGRYKIPVYNLGLPNILANFEKQYRSHNIVNQLNDIFRDIR